MSLIYLQAKVMKLNNSFISFRENNDAYTRIFERPHDSLLLRTKQVNFSVVVDNAICSEQNLYHIIWNFRWEFAPSF